MRYSSDIIANKRMNNERQAVNLKTVLRDAADKDFLEHFERVMTTPEGRVMFERLLQAQTRPLSGEFINGATVGKKELCRTDWREVEQLTKDLWRAKREEELKQGIDFQYGAYHIYRFIGEHWCELPNNRAKPINKLWDHAKDWKRYGKG